MRFHQQSIILKKETITFDQYMQMERSIIIDNDFLKFSENLRMNNNIKVFARISPENKALIVKRIKGEIEKARKKIPRCQRIFDN